MTSPRKPGFVIPVAVTLAVLLALYVGAYYAMMDRTWDFAAPPARRAVVNYAWPDQNNIRPRRYFDSGSLASRFFAPMHYLDRRVRAEFWNPPGW